MNAGKWWDMAAERTWVMTLSEYRMKKKRMDWKKRI